MDEKAHDDVVRVAVEFMLCQALHPATELRGRHEGQQDSPHDLKNAIDAFEDQTDVKENLGCRLPASCLAMRKRRKLHSTQELARSVSVSILIMVAAIVVVMMPIPPSVIMAVPITISQ